RDRVAGGQRDHNVARDTWRCLVDVRRCRGERFGVCDRVGQLKRCCECRRGEVERALAGSRAGVWRGLTAAGERRGVAAATEWQDLAADLARDNDQRVDVDVQQPGQQVSCRLRVDIQNTLLRAAKWQRFYHVAADAGRALMDVRLRLGSEQAGKLDI